MAHDEKRRQKALMKKRKKDSERKRSQPANAPVGHANMIELIKSARDLKIHECLINEDWQERGIVEILISRKQNNGSLIFGVYLVDTGCLGLKNTFCNTNISMDTYENNLKARLSENFDMVNCGYELANNIIYGAIRYAKKLGFEAQKDFKLSKYVLGTELEMNPDCKIQFGKDGKPFYCAGPDDDVERVINTLNKSVGKDNYHFIVPLDLK